jgi:hypothetical protein
VLIVGLQNQMLKLVFLIYYNVSCNPKLLIVGRNALKAIISIVLGGG